MKKENKFYEETDENGQKKYKIYVEYNLLSEDETRYYHEYYEELEMRRGKDKDFKISSAPVPPTPVVITPNPYPYSSSPQISKGYSEIVDPNKKYVPAPIHLSSNMYSKSIPQNTGFLTSEPSAHMTSGGGESQYVNQLIHNLSTHGETSPKSVFNLQGHLYEGYITQDAEGNQYLAVDADYFKSRQL